MRQSNQINAFSRSHFTVNLFIMLRALVYLSLINSPPPQPAFPSAAIALSVAPLFPLPTGQQVGKCLQCRGYSVKVSTDNATVTDHTAAKLTVTELHLLDHHWHTEAVDQRGDVHIRRWWRWRRPTVKTYTSHDAVWLAFPLAAAQNLERLDDAIGTTWAAAK